MRIHYLQHVPYEGLGSIREWITEHGHELDGSRMFAGDPLPRPDAFDFLIAMGGPMGVHDVDLYPWLAPEKACIRSAIKAERIVLGICLGAQLIADVLGGRVTANRYREIGWFPVTRECTPRRGAPVPPLPPELLAFHWHGDTFSIPAGAVRLAGSAACANQGFCYGERVLALQFHPEVTGDDVTQFIRHGMPKQPQPPWEQSAAEMLRNPRRFDELRPVMFALLDCLTACYPDQPPALRGMMGE